MGLCASSPSAKDGGDIIRTKNPDLNDLAAVDPQLEMRPSPAAAAAAATPPGPENPPSNKLSLSTCCSLPLFRSQSRSKVSQSLPQGAVQSEFRCSLCHGG
eukprot:gene16819-23098_t